MSNGFLFNNAIAAFTVINEDVPNSTTVYFIYGIDVTELEVPDVKSVRWENHFAIVRRDYEKIKSLEGDLKGTLELLNSFTQVSEFEFELFTN